MGGSAGGAAAGAATGSWLGPLGAIGGSIIGGLFGQSGQNSANAANLQIARENRDWQEKMSNTAYTRAAADLDRAGLNRILAFGSPASTPAGNVAHMENPKKQLGEAVSNSALMAAQIRHINSQTKLTDAQRLAIAPASTLGRGVEGGASAIQQKLTGLASAGEMKERFMDDMKKVGETISDHLPRTALQRQSKAEERVANIAESMGLRPEQAIPLLLSAVDEMDAPKNMTRTEKLEWALAHQEELKRFIQRKRQMGYQQ